MALCKYIYFKYIYFHQSASVQKTKSGCTCLPKIFERCPLAWLAMYPLSSSVNIQILRTVLKRIRQENLFKDQLQSISVNWSFLTPHRSLGANAISLYNICQVAETTFRLTHEYSTATVILSNVQKSILQTFPIIFTGLEYNWHWKVTTRW